MAPESDRPARWATFALMAVAYAACEVASDTTGSMKAFGIGFGVGLLALALLSNFLIPRPTAQRQKPPILVVAILAGLLILPILAEPVLRRVTDTGQPLELQMVNGLRNVGLALAAASVWPICRRTAGVVALFLALFASAMGDQPAMPYFLGAFAVMGGIWLVLNYRAESAGTVASQSKGFVVERVRLAFPVRELLVFGVLAAASISVAVAGPKNVMLSLGELAPTSGGTGEQDPFARYGTNDGPEETAGDDPNSAGMVDTNNFIESRQDSLIDAVSDMYGAPHKPPKNQERMVASGLADVKQNHGKLPENRRPSRDFGTSRQAPKHARKGESQSARALIEVEGRTPLHIRVVVYDRYDPADAYWLESKKPSSRFLEPLTEGSDWMVPQFRGGRGSWYAADDSHRFKIATPTDNLVPTPTHLSRVRISRVNRAEYYEWDYEGVLALSGRKRTPAGVVVQTECHTVQPGQLSEQAFPSVGLIPCAPACLEVPQELAPKLESIARAWVGDRQRGWAQIEAILHHLRTEYRLDPKATAPAGHPSPILWFLTESHCGPDYLFATAAALLVRSLDYPSRLCMGYYVSPEAFDPVTQHTPVRETDLHFWPEVMLQDGLWLTIEPTPGYETLPPRKPWTERAMNALQELGNWAVRHAIVIVVLVVAFALAVWRRKRLIDRAWTLLWRLTPGQTWQNAALRATKLLERRAALAGVPRSKSQTLADWSARLQKKATADEGLAQLIGLGEYAAYAPTLPPPIPADAVYELCRRTLQHWTLHKLHSATR